MTCKSKRNPPSLPSPKLTFGMTTLQARRVPSSFLPAAKHMQLSEKISKRLLLFLLPPRIKTCAFMEGIAPGKHGQQPVRFPLGHSELALTTRQTGRGGVSGFCTLVPYAGTVLLRYPR